MVVESENQTQPDTSLDSTVKSSIEFKKEGKSVLFK